MNDDTRYTILTTSIELFKSKGYDKVSINEICKTCNIVKGTFYYNYNSKDQLLLDYFFLVNKDINLKIEQLDYSDSWLEKCWQLKKLYLQSLADLGPDMLKNLLSIDLNNGTRIFDYKINDYDSIIKMIREKVVEYTIKAQLNNELRADADPALLSECFAATLSGIAMKWSSQNGNFSFLDEAYKFFLLIYH